MHTSNNARVAIVAMLSTCSGQPAGAESGTGIQRSDSTSACTVEKSRDRRLEERRLEGRGWVTTIRLDPCVPEPVARRIAGAINSGRLVNRQAERVRSQGSTGRPPIPRVRLRQVRAIRLVDPSEMELAPGARYAVSTVAIPRPATPEGLVLLVEIRRDDVELHSVLTWQE